jgi:uncharacterized protein with NRDE domain
MCLLLLARDIGPQRPWLLLANRDEFHGRPSAPAQAWPDAPDVVGGRDLEAGGTWLALNRNGRFAAVTNIRGGRPQRGARSRGELVAGFVRGSEAPQAYAAACARRGDQYGPFNLIVGDRAAAAGASSTSPRAWQFDRGVHVISNGPPGSEWPKTQRIGAGFAALLQSVHVDNAGTARPVPQPQRSAAGWPDDAALLGLLADSATAADEDLPDTGVGLDLERILSPIFVTGSQYGTRASTLAYARDDGTCVLVERRFGPDGVALGEERIETR